MCTQRPFRLNHTGWEVLRDLPATPFNLPLMPDYAVLGGCLRSEIEFPQLRLADGSDPTWTLGVSERRGELSGMELLGEDHVDQNFFVRAYKHSAGFRLEFDDTGTFDVSVDGRHITWSPGAEASIEAARLDVTGRVLALALHASGTLCLHGSAVALARGAIAFLAPKFHGKSTLAFALVSGGARLLTDDMLPVELDAIPYARPGVHNIRLWGDSFDRLMVGHDDGGTVLDGKHTLSQLADDQLQQVRTPLSAVYLLAPVAATAQEVARRTLLPPVAAALALVSNSSVGRLLGKSEAPVCLDRAAILAREVPVYRLELARDYAALPRVVRRLVQWHDGSTGRSRVERGVGGVIGSTATASLRVPVVSPNAESIISVRELSKRFPVRRRLREILRHPFSGSTVEVLRSVSCDIYAGEFFGLLGPNGAGKTTLAENAFHLCSSRHRYCHRRGVRCPATAGLRAPHAGSGNGWTKEASTGAFPREKT